MAKRPLEAPGGYKQKARWNEEASASTSRVSAKSVLAEYLIDKWAWGEISASAVQTIASCAVQDGLTNKEVQVLAKLGSSGLYPNHCHHELMNKLGAPHIKSAISSIDVYMRKQQSQMVLCSSAILLPHELFSVIYDKHKDVFLQRLCGGSYSNIDKFWTSMGNHPAYPSHPLVSRDDHKTRCVPLSLHGDGVPVTGVGKSWSKSMEAYTWNSLLGKGSTIMTNFLIFMFFTQLVIKNADFDLRQQFFKRLHWSFYWLFIGKWPSRDENGKAFDVGSEAWQKKGKHLADGFYGALWCLRGDLEHMSKAYGFPWPTSVSPCALCRANTSDVPWTDGRPGAQWLTTVWSNADLSAAHPERHTLFQLPGVGITAFVPDHMHTLHLGCYQYAFGSALKYLTSCHGGQCSRQFAESLGKVTSILPGTL